jgi:hypothetical protein
MLGVRRPLRHERGAEAHGGRAANGNQDEARRFFQTAVRHYDQAITKRGDSIDNTVYRNLMLAHSRLGQHGTGAEFGQRATTVMADDAQTWMVYADVLAARTAWMRRCGPSTAPRDQPGPAEHQRPQGDDAARGQPRQRRRGHGEGGAPARRHPGGDGGEHLAADDADRASS